MYVYVCRMLCRFSGRNCADQLLTMSSRMRMVSGSEQSDMGLLSKDFKLSCQFDGDDYELMKVPSDYSFEQQLSQKSRPLMAHGENTLAHATNMLRREEVGKMTERHSQTQDIVIWPTLAHEAYHTGVSRMEPELGERVIRPFLFVEHSHHGRSSSSANYAVAQWAESTTDHRVIPCDSLPDRFDGYLQSDTISSPHELKGCTTPVIPVDDRGRPPLSALFRPTSHPVANECTGELASYVTHSPLMDYSATPLLRKDPAYTSWTQAQSSPIHLCGADSGNEYQVVNATRTQPMCFSVGDSVNIFTTTKSSYPFVWEMEQLRNKLDEKQSTEEEKCYCQQLCEPEIESRHSQAIKRSLLMHSPSLYFSRKECCQQQEDVRAHSNCRNCHSVAPAPADLLESTDNWCMIRENASLGVTCLTKQPNGNEEIPSRTTRVAHTQDKLYQSFGLLSAFSRLFIPKSMESPVPELDQGSAINSSRDTRQFQSERTLSQSEPSVLDGSMSMLQDTLYPEYHSSRKEHQPICQCPLTERITAEAIGNHPKAEADIRELKSFACRFKQRRMKLGITQAEVGRALGRLDMGGLGCLSQSTICRFESLTLSHNNMLVLKPVLEIWLEQTERRHLNAIHMSNEPFCSTTDPMFQENDRRRRRTSITDPEKRALEAYFHAQPKPSADELAVIANRIKLKKSVVRVWFCNQRQKQKRLQTKHRTLTMSAQRPSSSVRQYEDPSCR